MDIDPARFPKWTLLATSEDRVLRQGDVFPAWFEIELRDPDWPTEVVLFVVVDEHRGPILNGFRGGHEYKDGYQTVIKLLRERWTIDLLLAYVTAQARAVLETNRVLEPYLDRLPANEEVGRLIVELRDRFAEKSFKASTVQRRRRVTRELLDKVAETYRRAYEIGGPPTQAVAEVFNVSHSTAGRWVVEARKVGALGPATGRKAGEAGTTVADAFGVDSGADPDVTGALSAD